MWCMTHAVWPADSSLPCAIGDVASKVAAAAANTVKEVAPGVAEGAATVAQVSGQS